MTDNPFPDEAPVLVRYPRSKQEEQGARSAWPWLPGYVVSRCGPDEWEVCVEAREVAVLGDGLLAPAGTLEEGLLYPVCFWDASELRPAPDRETERRCRPWACTSG